MSTILEQLTSGTKSNLEAQHAINAELGVKLAACLEEFTKLNAGAIKASMADSAIAAENIFHAENPQQFAVSGASYLKQEMHSAMFYWRELMRIGFTTRKEINQAEMEWITESNHQGVRLLTEWIKSAPIGTERMLDSFTSAWVATSKASAKSVADGAGDPLLVAGSHASRKNNEPRSTGKSTH